jgi:hypothetical protein
MIMLINAILAIILLAVLGSLANRIMCCGGNLLHNVLAGGCGILLSYVVRSVFFTPELAIIWILVIDLASTCVAAWVICNIRIHMAIKKLRRLEEQKESEKQSKAITESMPNENEGGRNDA